MKKELVYPIFLETCKYTDDGFWRQVFEDLAYGKTPYGSYINKGFLCCNYKGKEFSYKIDSQDSKKLFEDVFELLSKRLGVESSADKSRKIKDFVRIQEEIMEVRNSKWSGIKKKSTRDSIIENFIVEMKKKWNLTDSDARRLNSVINISLLFKTISSKDIEYEGGKITSIANIFFKEGGVEYEFETDSVEMPSYTIVFQEKVSFLELWSKYIQDLKKSKKVE